MYSSHYMDIWFQLSQKYQNLRIDHNQLEEEFSKLQSQKMIEKQNLISAKLLLKQVTCKYEALKTDYELQV